MIEVLDNYVSNDVKLGTLDEDGILLIEDDKSSSLLTPQGKKNVNTGFWSR